LSAEISHIDLGILLFNCTLLLKKYDDIVFIEACR
jgi:hypothetical protein